MDRTGKPKKEREVANQSELNETDAAALPSVTGHESSNIAPSDSARPVGGRRHSEVTGPHDADSGANETVDGLTPSEEATRRGAENIPIGAPERELEDVPVFDRADALPKV